MSCAQITNYRIWALVVITTVIGRILQRQKHDESHGHQERTDTVLRRCALKLWWTVMSTIPTSPIPACIEGLSLDS